MGIMDTHVSRRTFVTAAAVGLLAAGLGGAGRTFAEEAEQVWTCDVVVVGAGSAGVTAAGAAAEAGASVILIEKEGWMAGSSSLAQGGIYAAGTEIQKAAGIEDDPDTFYEYLLSRGGDKLDLAVQRFCADHFGETVSWMVEELGIPFSEKVQLRSVDSIPRRHGCATNNMDGLNGVYDYAVRNGVDFRFGVAATGLLVDEAGAVVGVTAQDADGNPVRIDAQKTIMACGGFCRNAALDGFVGDATPNDGEEPSSEELAAQREAGHAVTADYELDPHGGRHGTVTCGTCHDDQVLFCGTCHNDVDLPEGWVAATDDAVNVG